MLFCRRHGSILVAVLMCAAAPRSIVAAELVSPEALGQLELRRTWQLAVPLDAGESVTRNVLLDDCFYVLTSENRVFAVHAYTGVIRWSARIGEPGQTVRGPTHTGKFAVFTAPGSVRLLDRHTGEVKEEPRKLRGVVIEVLGETATISIGTEHGLRVDDVLDVRRSNDEAEVQSAVIAKLKIYSVQNRSARGHIDRLDSGVKPRSGDRVRADTFLPLKEVKLPFAASSAAVADDARLYVGAANERFYCLDILGGTTRWQLLTLRTVSATPVLFDDRLIIAGQDGRVTCCTKERAKVWTFDTEAPIFVTPVVADGRVFVSSTDRSLYCIDLAKGKLLWRERFDKPLGDSAVYSHDRVYQRVAEDGLYALDAKTGKQLWHHGDEQSFLTQFGEDAFLMMRAGSPSVCRVDAASGKVKYCADAHGARFADANQGEGLILLCADSGLVECLRARLAPPLRPADLTAMLVNERRARLAAEAIAAAKVKPAATSAPAEEPLGSLMFSDESLASRSTAVPAGGHGLVNVEGKPAETAKPGAKEGGKGAAKGAKVKGKPAKKSSDDEEDSEGDESADEEKDSGAKEKDAGAKGKDKGKDEKKAAATSQPTSKPGAKDKDEDSDDDDDKDKEKDKDKD